ncbi:histidine phosphatase family protein [Nocardioides jejuensis]|nr:histidine phosphatase family protein [Nocardioides jejuensis]
MTQGQTAGLDGSTSSAPSRGWGRPGMAPTRIVLVRHGETDHTTDKRFSGGLASANPPLNELGRRHVWETAEWLATVGEQVDVVLSSPVRRTLESAEIVAEVLGQREVLVDDGFAEMEFGTWDGMTFLEVAEKFPDELKAWFGDLDHAPGGGESFRTVQARVLAGLERVIEAHAGKTVVLVSHVTPIKTLVAQALGAPLEALYRMELQPASVTVLSWFLGGSEGDELMASMRVFNATPGAHWDGAFPL